MLRLVAIATLLLASFLYTQEIAAQDRAAQEKAACDSQGWSRGIWIGFNKCGKELGGAGAKECLMGQEACCLDKAGNPQCVQYDVPFTPALPDVTSTEGLSKEAQEKIKKAEEEAKKKGPLTFTPNVPIPGLFEGTQPVTGSLFAQYVGAFYVYFIGVIGILAVVVMMWGGYHYIVSAGNPAKMQQGKEIISNALIGLVLALISFLLLRLINPALVIFPKIVPSFIVKKLQKYEAVAKPDKVYVARPVDVGALSQDIQRIKKNGYDQLVKKYGDQTAGRLGLDADFKYRLLALLIIESHGMNKQISSSGACGLIQLLPTTAGVSCQELMVPDTNIRIAAEHFGGLVKKPCPSYPTTKAGKAEALIRLGCYPENEASNPCTQDIMFANAAYNAGQGSNWCSENCGGNTTVWECGVNTRYGQTRQYVGHAQTVYAWLKDTKNFQF